LESKLPAAPLDPSHIAADGEDNPVQTAGQTWLNGWHGPGLAPKGRRHGSNGICLTAKGESVLVTEDGARWDLPGGRPEGDETWEQTLRREMREEACADVGTATLLGFARGRCIEGHERGLVLVRSFWLAEVSLGDWLPKFEILERKLVPARELISHLTIEPGFLPIYRRAMVEAGLG
jgi:ADP-ribose pyrophosphatase YjhB (NUDIX family)